MDSRVSNTVDDPNTNRYTALPEALVSEENEVELLNEIVHGHHDSEGTLFVGEPDFEDILRQARDRLKELPWYKRPSPWWLMISVPLAAAAVGMTIAPRIEIYTILACRVHRPEYIKDALSYFAPADTFTNPSNDCASDPFIQAAVAKLTTIMTTCAGVLTIITTAWWGSYSDRHGRATVMGISIFGLLITDFNFIFVAHFSKYVPGGYWFLLVGPLLEGLLGGLGSAIAAVHAYTADTTNPSERSRYFSISLGLMFGGVALGPTVGSILIRATSNILSVFYVSTAVHLLYAFLVWFILPESLTKEARKRSVDLHAQETQAYLASRRSGKLRNLAKASIGFLTPLAILLPRNNTSNKRGNLKAPKRDWNLVLCTASYAFMICLIGGQSVKYQFAIYAFGWGSTEIGYWLSLIAGMRAFYLTILLPFGIKLFERLKNRKSRPKHLPHEEEVLLLPEDGSVIAPSEPVKTSLETKHSPQLDLVIARTSLAIDIIAYALIGIFPSPVVYVVYGILSAFGSGFTPALQSVALELYTRGGGTESGRLFGALSVLQALGSSVIGPSIFGLTFIRTVSFFPQAIFFVSTSLAVISLLLLSLVRIPQEHLLPRDGEEDLLGDEIPETSHQQDTTLID